MDKDKKSSRPRESKAGDGTAGGFSPSFDTQKARELYDMGMRDVELMKQLGAPRGEVIEWRKQNGLTANRIIIWNEKRAHELYAAGATDKQIAEDLSKAGGEVSISAVTTWRRKNKLETNPRGVWAPPDDKSEAKTPEDKKKTPNLNPVPTVEGGTRHGHLVALPSAPKREEDSVPPGMPKRGFHQRKRNKAEMPLPTTFARPMTGADFFDDLEGMDFGESAGVPEQEAIYMFATILHLCRMDYGWDSDEVGEFIDAVEFAEEILYNTAAQTGTMDSRDSLFDDDDYDFEYVQTPKPKSKSKQKQKKSGGRSKNAGASKSSGGSRKSNGGGPKNSGGPQKSNSGGRGNANRNNNNNKKK